MTASQPNVVTLAPAVAAAFDLFRFAYGEELAGRAFDLACENALFHGRTQAVMDDWRFACRDADVLAEREAVHQRQLARATYELAAARAAASGRDVELQPGAVVTPAGSVRLTSAWIEANAEPVN
jgi:hypothetical protein